MFHYQRFKCSTLRWRSDEVIAVVSERIGRYVSERLVTPISPNHTGTFDVGVQVLQARAQIPFFPDHVSRP